MKICVGAGVWITRTPNARASTLGQDSTSGSKPAVPETGTGWKNDSHRAAGNGPMDEPSRQLVRYVSSFSESDLTDSLVDAVGTTMLDSIASLVAGFESEPARICARLARSTRSDMKSTVSLGCLPPMRERRRILALSANGVVARILRLQLTVSPGGHFSDMISAVLGRAVGEALHSTGSQVMVAIALAYEVAGAR